MATFGEANQAKLSLKMTLSNYAWYQSVAVVSDGDDWCILVHVDKLDTRVRKVVPIVHKGITVKVDADSKPTKK